MSLRDGEALKAEAASPDRVSRNGADAKTLPTAGGFIGRWVKPQSGDDAPVNGEPFDGRDVDLGSRLEWDGWVGASRSLDPVRR